VAGGFAVKIIEKIKDGLFSASRETNGIFEHLLEKYPGFRGAQ